MSAEARDDGDDRDDEDTSPLVKELREMAERLNGLADRLAERHGIDA